MDCPEPVVTEPLLDDPEGVEEEGEVGREVWSRPTVSDAPGVVRNPLGLPLTIVMMDGDDPCGGRGGYFVGPDYVCNS